MARRLSIDQYVDGVTNGDRTLLARAITLIESRLDEDQKLAQEVLTRVLPKTGGAHRVGISGVPGVGKSTLIEALGARLVETEHRVAVLAVDPSSRLSGGSILGDKSRMDRLAQLEGAFIRPSPSAATLGGVARRTRETMLLCEAAGFDVVIVETVGVGQSETVVADMVDCFVLLLLPGAGDELQGIKRGILEIADLLAINKADGDRLPLAREAAREYGAALRYLRPRLESWKPKTLLVSAKTGDGMAELWAEVEAHHQALRASGELENHRRAQLRRWMWSLIDESLLHIFRRNPKIAELLPRLELEVIEGHLPPTKAVQTLLAAFEGNA
ncbi:MAG: methylmalonyl Co-A mutase-associated GTPase MeaB [Planctomycetota bacterium]